MNEEKSYFPIKIKYIHKEYEEIVDHPKYLESGKAFVVLECNVNKQKAP